LFPRSYRGSKEGITTATPEASILVKRVLHNFSEQEGSSSAHSLRKEVCHKTCRSEHKKTEKKNRVHIQIDWNELQPMA
jgi:hypothetical protein